MIITLEPHIVGSKLDYASTQESIADSSYILSNKAQHYYWKGIGPLSIKAFFSGQAYYDIGDGCYAVGNEAYLVLNHGQTYAITIEADSAVESFCLFFEDGFAEEVYHSLVTRPDRLVDNPEIVIPITEPIHFFERTYQHDTLLSPSLLGLRSEIAHGIPERDWLNEHFHDLMQRLLQVHLNVYKEIEALPAVRAATREEIYRRLYRAKDYASALFDTPITLDEMARVAALSPNHFLRTFKHLFHQTPYQYVISKRLERAQQLLLQTDLPVTDICFSLSFESPGSFSWLFHQRIGCSPAAYRRQNQKR
jgi:AraC family transcriptional regulator